MCLEDLSKLEVNRSDNGKIIWTLELLDALRQVHENYDIVETSHIFENYTDIGAQAARLKMRDLGFTDNIERLPGECFVVMNEAPDYEVSNYGRIKKTLKIGERILTGTKRANGYITFHATINGKKKNIFVHRAVAKAFIPNPENKPEVDHIDGDRTNNKVSNLRWATTEENANNPVRLARMIQNSKNKGLTIVETDDEGNPIRLFSYMSDLYKSLGLTYISNLNGTVDIFGRHFLIVNRNSMDFNIAKLLHTGHTKQEIIEAIKNYNEEEYKEEVYRNAEAMFN